jgi:hypothetical protein
MNAYHRLCALAACSGIAAAAASGTGYLSTGSPVALRFQPETAAVGKPTLPPLPGPPAESSVSPRPAVTRSNATATVTTAQSPKPVAEPTAAPEGFELTPQMLVDIFRSRAEEGKGRDTHVLVPFGFIPSIGQVRPAGSAPTNGTSTATYRIQ